MGEPLRSSPAPLSLLAPELPDCPVAGPGSAEGATPARSVSVRGPSEPVVRRGGWQGRDDSRRHNGRRSVLEGCFRTTVDRSTDRATTPTAAASAADDSDRHWRNAAAEHPLTKPLEIIARAGDAASTRVSAAGPRNPTDSRSAQCREGQHNQAQRSEPEQTSPRRDAPRGPTGSHPSHRHRLNLPSSETHSHVTGTLRKRTPPARGCLIQSTALCDQSNQGRRGRLCCRWGRRFVSVASAAPRIRRPSRRRSRAATRGRSRQTSRAYGSGRRLASGRSKGVNSISKQPIPDAASGKREAITTRHPCRSGGTPTASSVRPIHPAQRLRQPKGRPPGCGVRVTTLGMRIVDET